MKLNCFIVLVSVIQINFYAQISPTDKEFEAQPIGINDQLENILQTQLTLPKIVLRTDLNEKETVFMNVDSSGRAFNLKFDKGLNNLVRNEIKRVLGFVHFKRTLHLLNEEAPYFITIPISSHVYNKYKKQKEKPIVKSNKIADSSMVIYSRADRSPVFYKNGDEGLSNFFISELDYPKVAIQQSIEGTVVLDFVVETNGYVTNIVVKKFVNGGCTEEAVRLIKKTRWQPAEKGDKLVRYKITYPITFNLKAANSGNQLQSVGQ